MLNNKINTRKSQTDMEDCRGLYKTVVKFWTFIEIVEYLKWLYSVKIK